MSPPSFVLAPAGRGVLDALIDTIGEAQSDDPFAPVLVVVPTLASAASIRGRLAATPGGFANVDVLTGPQLIDHLAAPAMLRTGVRRLSATREAAAVRAVLAEARPPLARVASSAATEEAMAAAFGVLRSLPERLVPRLAATSARAAEVVRLFDLYRDRVDDRADRVDRAELAVAAADAHRGVVVHWSPARLDPVDLSLAAALARAGTLRAVVAATDDAEAEPATAVVVEQFRSLLGAPLVLEGSPVAPIVECILAVDPADEADHAVRQVLAVIAGGGDPARMAVAFRGDSPYRVVLAEAFGAAGVPHSMGLSSTLAHSVSGRSLLGLLALAERDLRRTDVLRWMRSAPIRFEPIRFETVPLPVARWARWAREAGVVGGADQWAERLGRFGAEQRSRADEAERAGEPERAERRRRTAADVDGLARFIAEIGATLASAPRSWAPWSAWASSLLDRFVPVVAADGWSRHEEEADQRVRAVLAELGRLPDPPSSRPGEFARVLGEELHRSSGRTGRRGAGVTIGRVDELAGVDLDLLVVVGMEEGRFPPRVGDDPLLPAADRVAAGVDQLVPLPDRAEERRQWCSLRASSARLVGLAGQADVRAQRPARPAAWWLDEVELLAGRRVPVDDLHAADVGGLHVMASVVASTGAPGPAVDANHHDLRALLAGRDAVVAGRHPLLDLEHDLGRGMAAIQARAAGEFGPWSGHIGPHSALDESGVVASATRLETWAACPHRYFLDRVLRVAEFQEPEEVDGLSARDRGSVVHEILERFIDALVDAPVDPGWTDSERARLHALTDDVLDEYVAGGRAGRRLRSDVDRRLLVDLLERVLRDDADRRARTGLGPVAVEHVFGDDEGTGPAAQVRRRDGGVVRFRGMVDRIDASADGTRVEVTDYKTGSGSRYRVVDRDIVGGGQILQLPIYADAARRHLGGGPDPAVTARFWFVEQSGAAAERGGVIDDAARQRASDVISTIVEGIEDGVFPVRPGQEDTFRRTFSNCGYCAYDRLCSVNRVDHWEQGRTHHAVDDYRNLVEPPS